LRLFNFFIRACIIPAMALSRHLLRSVIASGLLMGVAWLPAAEEGAESQLEFRVSAIEAATGFSACVGSGPRILPPDDIGGGDSIALVSISNGATVRDREVRYKDEKVKLIKITFTVRNPTQEPTVLKLGDMRLLIGSGTLRDVGYDFRFCDMPARDVKKLVVEVDT
jgi:hypothetical protein